MDKRLQEIAHEHQEWADNYYANMKRFTGDWATASQVLEANESEIINIATNALEDLLKKLSE